MKRVFIIHGWDGKPNEHWMPWLSQQLETQKFTVYQPEMPESDNPNANLWVAALKNEVGVADKDTFFVCHSIGCLALFKYLEKYREQIGGAVLVAPWLTLTLESVATPEAKVIADSWTNPAPDFNLIRGLSPVWVALFSTNDPDVPFLENKTFFEEKLRAKVFTYGDKGHFTESEGVTELPDALEELLKMANEN